MTSFIFSSNFNATIRSKGDYEGLAQNRYYGVRIYNVLTPKRVQCNGERVDYNVLFWDQFERENTYYYDGHEMALTVNCPVSVLSNKLATVIDIEFDKSWSAMFEYTALKGMRGKISRSNQCKAALDEANYQYGTTVRSNMTMVASYGMLLGNLGGDYKEHFEKVQQFEVHWKYALEEVKALEPKIAGTERYQFCNDLYDSISL